MSLNKKIISVVAFACALGAIISISGFLFFNQKEHVDGIISKERTIHTQLSAATKYVANQGGLKDVILKFQSKYNSAEKLSESEKKEILNQVPIYAAMVIGKENQTTDNYEFRVFSNEPRRKENLATPAEMEIFKKFDSDPSLEELIDNDGNKITVYKPVHLHESQGCLVCHGAPSTSPWKNGTDILGYKMEDWKDGKLHGVFAVSQHSKENTAAAGASFLSPSSYLIIAITLGALISILLAYYLMKGSIQSLIDASNSILNVSTSVNSSAIDVASSSQAIANAATEQAASLAETATSLEQITSMIAKASDNANSTATSSSESKDKAEQGKEAVDQMLSSMDEISQSNEAILNQINESNQQMSEIVKVIQEIGNRTKVINEIVFQTKLLSFNASVEAARAGDHGKGFAVVAEEVGNLAQMSGNAAKEISEMLEGSISRVEGIVRETQQKVEVLVESGKTKVETGVQVAKQCSETLTEIVQKVSQMSDLSQEISQATKEQSLGVAEINKAMSQLDSVTQQNASASEKSAGSADQLSNQAIALRNSINELMNVIKGDKPSTNQTNSSTDNADDTTV